MNVGTHPVAVTGGEPARTGAIAMEWSQALRLAHLDQPGSEHLLEQQEQLKKAHVLAAFGSRVVVFARAPE